MSCSADGGSGWPRNTALATEALIWSVGAFTFDERRLVLMEGDTAIEVEARPLELLRHLLQHAGELVTKDELLESVWPGRIPSESVLTKTVAKLRHALKDEDQQLIRTIYGQGYRLVAPVTVRIATSDPRESVPVSLKAGDRIRQRSNWSLTEILGSTGRSEVWLATQSKTHQKRVFKFARDGLGLRSLKREITLYRVLQSTPGIGDHVLPIIDWNLDEAPFFIEYPHVPSGSLQQWLEDAQQRGDCPHEVRLELIAQIAATLSAAHAAGVLHKDIKPGNVLIDHDAAGRPFVRLADFGEGEIVDVARLAQLEITRLGFTQTVFERDGSSGTPLYLAPELLAGQMPSVRSDIYALGIVLYQTILGDFRRPLAPGWERDVEDELLREDIGACADVDPTRRLADAQALADRLRTLTERRATQQALEKERAENERLRQRYERIRLLRPWYALTAIVLVIAAFASTVLWLKAERATTRASAEAELNEAVNRFLTEDLLGAANPLRAGRRDVTVAEVLAQASSQAGTRFAAHPHLEAAVRKSIGHAYGGLSDFEAGDHQLRIAIERLEGQPERAHQLAEARVALLELLIDGERTEEAVDLLQTISSEPLATPSQQLRVEAARHWLAIRQGDHREAIEKYAALQPQYAALWASDPYVARRYEERLIETYVYSGEIAQGLEFSDSLRSKLIVLYGEEDGRTMNATLGSGQMLALSGRHEEALEVLQQTHDTAVKRIGPESDLALTAAAEVAGTLESLKRYDEAEALYDQLLAARLRRDGPEDLATRTLQANLAYLYDVTGRSELALSRYRALLELETRLNGESHPDTLIVSHQIAIALGKLQRWKEALQTEQRTFDLARKVLPPGHWHLAMMEWKLGEILANLDRGEEALQHVVSAIPKLEEHLGPEHDTTRRAKALQQSLGEDLASKAKLAAE